MSSTTERFETKPIPAPIPFRRRRRDRELPKAA
jgi:hypothetical protein